MRPTIHRQPVQAIGNRRQSPPWPDECDSQRPATAPVRLQPDRASDRCRSPAPPARRPHRVRCPLPSAPIAYQHLPTSRHRRPVDSRRVSPTTYGRTPTGSSPRYKCPTGSMVDGGGIVTCTRRGSMWIGEPNSKGAPRMQATNPNGTDDCSPTSACGKHTTPVGPHRHLT